MVLCSSSVPPFLRSGAAIAADAPAQPRVKLGGTLFERMQNATRAAARSDDDGNGGGNGGGGDLPRFLNRQNNQ